MAGVGVRRGGGGGGGGGGQEAGAGTDMSSSQTGKYTGLLEWDLRLHSLLTTP